MTGTTEKTLNILRDKYKACPPPASEDPGGLTGDESPAVRFFRFLIENRRHGFFLVLSPDGCKPALRFEPGLESVKSSPAARIRWELAGQAWGLFVDAHFEICQLLYDGELRLPDGWHESGLHYVRITLQEIERYLNTIGDAAHGGL